MKLQRLMQTSVATCGRLCSDTNEERCKSLELPWRENATGISCIPAGHYTAKRRFSPEHRLDVFEIEHVQNGVMRLPITEGVQLQSLLT